MKLTYIGTFTLIQSFEKVDVAEISGELEFRDGLFCQMTNISRELIGIPQKPSSAENLAQKLFAKITI
jgi:hypothetical protein